jgi:hypothetical protein
VWSGFCNGRIRQGFITGADGLLVCLIPDLLYLAVGLGTMAPAEARIQRSAAEVLAFKRPELQQNDVFKGKQNE